MCFSSQFGDASCDADIGDDADAGAGDGNSDAGDAGDDDDGVFSPRARARAMAGSLVLGGVVVVVFVELGGGRTSPRGNAKRQSRVITSASTA